MGLGPVAALTVDLDVDALIVSEAFSGKSRIEQHQMVYAALGELMSGPVHALALKTYTPESWTEAKG